MPAGAGERRRARTPHGAPRSPISGGIAWSPTASGAPIVKAVAGRTQRPAASSYAADELEIEPSDLEIVDGVCGRRARPIGASAVAELAEQHDGLRRARSSRSRATAGALPPSLAPSTSRATSRTSASTARPARSRSCDYVVAQDVGRALNPALVEGQMRGGAAQGIGWALLEEMQFDDARPAAHGHRSWTTRCRAPATCRPIETLDRRGARARRPVRCRGVGEASVCGGAAAVANAVAAARRACGIDRLPMTPRRVLRALDRSDPAA